jgi:hypothetical protein
VIPSRIVSGAQTGADRAALDAARELGVEIGGWVPKGRRAEDGPVDECYVNLRETRTDHYETRTRLNVRDSDATLIVSHGELHGGSRYTREQAQALRKPCLHVDLDRLTVDEAVNAVHEWLDGLEGKTLNVAGPRESSDTEIYAATKEIVRRILSGG